MSSEELATAQTNLQTAEVECADLKRKLSKLTSECEALRKGADNDEGDKSGFWKEQVSHLEELLKAKEDAIN